ncbi:hypothetical protein [Parendozoicomonas sp. Alg238-R29]|uniref:hypothetical protein n=1 Tax=Parendozoicomonas sp. Alg238-R29 TaxID=2993446 RepID=UPI00248F394B|nr:hypothetical protein [Parendozoicomonas sp. Alg238-R29]
MATNGESARQWLADNGSTASQEELLRIRTAIATKLDAMPEEHPDEAGFLEALDVMDEWMEKGKTSEPENTTPSSLDTSPLVPDLPPAEVLSEEEKQARFKALLKKKHTLA